MDNYSPLKYSHFVRFSPGKELFSITHFRFWNNMLGLSMRLFKITSGQISLGSASNINTLGRLLSLFYPFVFLLFKLHENRNVGMFGKSGHSG